MTTQLHLEVSPLNADEQLLLDRLSSWVPSGIGDMRFDTMMYQFAWSRKRASAALQGLLDRGLVIRGGPCGEYYVKSVFDRF